MFRAALLVLSALSTGVSVGRKAVAREIDKRKTNIIETASAEARERIREQARHVVTSGTRAFMRRVLIKALILSVIWFVHWGGYLPGAGFRVIMTAAILSFIIYDLITSWPTLRLVAMEIKKHGPRPKRAVTELVAAQVFEEVLKEIDNREEAGWHEKLLLGLAGRDMSAMSREIAAAVAQTARETSWQDIRPFIVSAAIRIVSLMLLYSAFAALMMFRATHTG
ncbi:hypothetical protein [Parvularcula marina]|uniref:hypothetical protein n=1 Tax=Parvularcula marina TaxID=2292771 RepID=UPI00351108E7